jgi:hypothetical protein
VDVKTVTAQVDQPPRGRMSTFFTRFENALGDRAGDEKNEENACESEREPEANPQRRLHRHGWM